MQMQKEVRQHDDNPIAPIQRHRMTEDALPKLTIANGIAE
jgi:hypothetical protein